jgi:threonine dehydrogenase-like Zn-dependent dehydrogenase
MTMTEFARAAVITQPKKIEIQEFPVPEPGPGAVLLKMEMSGMCGTDKHTYLGFAMQYSGTEHARSIPFPVIPGHENVARIAAIGERKEPLLDFEGIPLKVGDRIVLGANIACGKCYYCTHGFDYYFCSNMEDYGNSLGAAKAPHLFGGWADYMYALPGSAYFKVPDDMPVEIAVLTEVMAVTIGLDKAKQFSAVDNEGFRFGDTVVVQGVGPLGLCHVMKARMLGAGRVVAIDRSSYRLKMALELGADVALDIKETDERARLQAVRDLTGGRGADVVVETAGVPEVFQEGLELLRPGGFYIECGNFSDMGTTVIKPHLLCAKNIRILGIGGEALTQYGPSLLAFQNYRKFYPMEKIVSHRFTVEQADEAMQRALSGESMKVVIASKDFIK